MRDEVLETGVSDGLTPLAQIGRKKGSNLSRYSLAVAVAIASAVAVVGAFAATRATAAATSTSYTIKATLNTKQEVPKPKDAIHAKGLFTGKLTLAGKNSRFVWRLKVSGLSGRIREAAISLGARGKRGTIALPLCERGCQAHPFGAYHGPYVANKTFVSALLHGRVYVTVTTKLNKRGEIRGQIKATAA